MADVQFAFKFSSTPVTQDAAIYQNNKFLQFLSIDNNSNTADAVLQAGDFVFWHRFFGDDGVSCEVTATENPNTPNSAQLFDIPANKHQINDAVTNGFTAVLQPFTVQ